jgi:hypothetical protein
MKKSKGPEKRPRIDPGREIDYDLSMEILGYEEKYFKDMTLRHKAIQDIFKCYEIEPDGKLVASDYGDPPLITLGGWIISETELHNMMGVCDSAHMEIKIKTGLKRIERKATFLHEMIHAYESELTWTDNYWDIGWLYILLYLRLMRKLGNKKAEELVKLASKSIYHVGGHSTLFTLKSFDLDLRLKQPFGYVLGYGRTDCFKNRKKSIV